MTPEDLERIVLLFSLKGVKSGDRRVLVDLDRQAGEPDVFARLAAARGALGHSASGVEIGMEIARGYTRKLGPRLFQQVDSIWRHPADLRSSRGGGVQGWGGEGYDDPTLPRRTPTLAASALLCSRMRADAPDVDDPALVSSAIVGLAVTDRARQGELRSEIGGPHENAYGRAARQVFQEAPALAVKHLLHRALLYEGAPVEQPPAAFLFPEGLSLLGFHLEELAAAVAVSFQEQAHPFAGGVPRFDPFDALLVEEEAPRLYVVHERAARTFVGACDTVGRLPPAALFLPDDAGLEDGLGTYFDRVLRASNGDPWGAVVDLAAHAGVLEVEAWASELDERALALLDRDPQGWDPDELPLPASIRSLLRHSPYREAFEAVAVVRLQMMDALAIAADRARRRRRSGDGADDRGPGTGRGRS